MVEGNKMRGMLGVKYDLTLKEPALTHKESQRVAIAKVRPGGFSSLAAAERFQRRRQTHKAGECGVQAYSP